MRSLLFVPADSERKLARAPHSGAGALILDLEDSVIPANRTLARSQARDFLVSTTAGGLRRYIRINPLSSGAALDDLAAVVPGNPDGILLPKCLPKDLRTLDHYLAALEVATSVSCGTIRVIAIATETPAAMFALGGYAGISARLEAITWSAEDLAACLGGNNRRADGTYDDVYRLARSLCLLGQRPPASWQSTRSTRTSTTRRGSLPSPRRRGDRASPPRWRFIRPRFR
jgi:citrate lyase subunit beta/citryl-CoA lyase